MGGCSRESDGRSTVGRASGLRPPCVARAVRKPGSPPHAVDHDQGQGGHYAWQVLRAAESRGARTGVWVGGARAKRGRRAGRRIRKAGCRAADAAAAAAASSFRVTAATTNNIASSRCSSNGCSSRQPEGVPARRARAARRRRQSRPSTTSPRQTARPRRWGPSAARAPACGAMSGCKCSVNDTGDGLLAGRSGGRQERRRRRRRRVALTYQKSITTGDMTISRVDVMACFKEAGPAAGAAPLRVELGAGGRVAGGLLGCCAMIDRDAECAAGAGR